MTFTVHITVMPLKELLDPQGKAVTGSLHNLGLSGIHDVRIGKHITLQLDAADEATAKSIAQDACKRLLANPVMEAFEINIVPAATATTA
jgi:phosphoribosylformylglycinamidine synthase